MAGIRLRQDSHGSAGYPHFLNMIAYVLIDKNYTVLPKIIYGIDITNGNQVLERITPWGIKSLITGYPKTNLLQL